ncbi:TIGR02328 family protein [Aquibacillus rhizosphaerae]|uniref:TIGR02328 family protein n=1 Tax=Aquibacillus rhizosphaerae TaxID=3051431 RepID=A0ABT7L971_9BACI|nr:TIGR02328 family protein [Aquibacillus sp. LR5S19]MDL4841120.1 TIGR02328 family protein [Aquibacillus sp. LR5S19]
MRLWHEELITHLPRQQLLEQHRECCALRGNGWGRPHATVNYIFDYAPILLFRYHERIMEEMEIRGYNVDKLWFDPFYRGKTCEAFNEYTLHNGNLNERSQLIYPEHDYNYLRECVENLNEKGIAIKLKTLKQS